MKLTLVLASQRSGSSLLCNDIGSLGGMGVPSEYFLRLLKQKAKPMPVRISRQIERGIVADTPDVGAVKAMVSYVPLVIRQLGLAKRLPMYEANQRFIEWAKSEYEAVNLIVLVRENTIDQAISRTLAKSTGVYHISEAEDEPEERDLDSLDEDALRYRILRSAARIAEEKRVLRQIHESNKDVSLLLSYDQIVSSADETASLLIEHAQKSGMSPKRSRIERKLRKVVPNDAAARLKRGLREFADQEFLRFAE